MNDYLQQRVFVEFQAADGKRTLVGTIERVGEETFILRTDRKPVRNHMLALSALLRVQEATQHGKPDHQPARA